MDEFDDLPDVVEKDDKPKFQTEMNNNSNLNQRVANLLMPLFGDDQSQKEEKVDDDHQDVEDADHKIQNATSHDEH